MKLANVLYVFLLGTLLYAQEKHILVRIVPFTVENVRADEGKLIESLVVSYLSDMDGITVFSGTGGEGRDAEESYELSGNIVLEKDNRVLYLNLNNPVKNLQKTQVYTYKTASDLALNVRSIVEDYFPELSQKTRREQDEALPINRLNIIGTWQGDSGVEIVRLSPNGKALAIFSSGSSMELSWTIEDRMLIITQVSPPSYRFFYPMPEQVARTIAEEADPMVWKFFLYENGAVLRGTVESTSAEYSGANEIKRIIHGKIQKSQWKKFSR
jgi:hypothetical protein